MEDLTYWPLVVGIYRDAVTHAAYERQLAQWEDCFAREQPFALLRVFTTPASVVPPRGSAAVGKDWLARNRPLLQRWVLGMATVILPPEDYARMKNFKVEKAFGVPGRVFDAAVPALAWLQTAVFAPACISVRWPALDALQ